MTRKLVLAFSILIMSLAVKGREIWPSMEKVVPLLTLRPRQSRRLLALITMGLKLSECGQIGVMTIPSKTFDNMGPPAARL